MGRITFVEYVYFEHPGEQVVDYSSPPHELITQTEDEDPYTRRYKLTPSPVLVDPSYLKDCPGMMTVKNLSQTAVVYLPGIKIPPRQTIKFWPNMDWNKLLIWASEEAKASVTIFPR